MRWLLRVATVFLTAIALLVGSVFAASEWGGEVIVLYTQDGSGEQIATRLWVVDDEGTWWIRAGMPGTTWLRHIRERPDVYVVRAGEGVPRVATPVEEAERRERVNALLRAKYGIADRWIGLLRDGSASVAVRLDPPEAASEDGATSPGP